MSLPAATVLVRSAISFDVAFSTKVGSWALVPGSLAEGKGPAFTIPADRKAPKMVWEITTVSSVGLNCEVDAAGDDSGRAMTTFSARCRFAGTTGVGLFTAWCLEARVEGLLEMVHDTTPTYIITIVMSKVSGCVPIPWGAIGEANHPK